MYKEECTTDKNISINSSKIPSNCYLVLVLSPGVHPEEFASELIGLIHYHRFLFAIL